MANTNKSRYNEIVSSSISTQLDTGLSREQQEKQALSTSSSRLAQVWKLLLELTLLFTSTGLAGRLRMLGTWTLLDQCDNEKEEKLNDK